MSLLVCIRALNENYRGMHLRPLLISVRTPKNNSIAEAPNAKYISMEEEQQ